MVCIFFLIEKNKNRFVFIPSYGLKWILKNSETLIGQKWIQKFRIWIWQEDFFTTCIKIYL